MRSRLTTYLHLLTLDLLFVVALQQKLAAWLALFCCMGSIANMKKAVSERVESLQTCFDECVSDIVI